MFRLLVVLLVGQVACQLECGDPASVTQLEVLNVTSRTLSLRWSAPGDDVAQCTLGYQVCWSAEEDYIPQQCSTFPAGTTQVTLTQLGVCANYTIEVTTLGTTVNSSPTTLSTYSGVGPIGSASAWTVNITTLSVAWGYDVFTNGPCGSHFQMLVCESANEDLTECNNYTVPFQATPEVFLTGLATCKEYFISLFAVDFESRLSDRNQISGYVDGLGVPTDIRFTDVSSSEVSVNWMLPQVDAVCPHEALLCHVREDGEARVCQSFQTESLTSFTLSDLQACTSYSVQVIILTSGDYFAASPLQHHTRAANGTMLAWVEARNVSDTQLTVAWQPLYASPPCVREYGVCWGQQNATSVCVSTNSSATSHRVTGLQQRTLYNLEVTALLTDGSRSDTVTTSITTSITTTDSSAMHLVSRTSTGLLLSMLLVLKHCM